MAMKSMINRMNAALLRRRCAARVALVRRGRGAAEGIPRVTAAVTCLKRREARSGKTPAPEPARAMRAWSGRFGL